MIVESDNKGNTTYEFPCKITVNKKGNIFFGDGNLAINFSIYEWSDAEYRIGNDSKLFSESFKTQQEAIKWLIEKLGDIK
jgi:hypothetical protein